MSTPIRLFDETSLRKLEQLTLSAAAVRVGALKGERQSRKRGTSIEFADYRNYAQGDDLRRLDWNVFARLERPYIKVTHDEEELAIHLLVDTSTSMNWPSNEQEIAGGPVADVNKLLYAFRLAGALGYIGLSGGDLVTVSLVDHSNKQTWGPFRSRQNGWPLIQFLEANLSVLVSPDQQARPRKTDIDRALRDYALRARRPGLFFLISDLFPSGQKEGYGFHNGIQALQSLGYEPVLIQLLSPDEVIPEAGGNLKLIDSETGGDADVTLDESVIQEYINRLQTWQQEIKAYCRSRRIHFLPTVTDKPWDMMVLQTLRREGVID